MEPHCTGKYEGLLSAVARNLTQGCYAGLQGPLIKARTNPGSCNTTPHISHYCFSVLYYRVEVLEALSRTCSNPRLIKSRQRQARQNQFIDQAEITLPVIIAPEAQTSTFSRKLSSQEGSVYSSLWHIGYSSQLFRLAFKADYFVQQCSYYPVFSLTLMARAVTLFLRLAPIGLLGKQCVFKYVARPAGFSHTESHDLTGDVLGELETIHCLYRNQNHSFDSDPGESESHVICSLPTPSLISHHNNAPKFVNPPTQRSIMARKAHRKDPSPTGLLNLPNEILLDIVSLLCISDVRRLGRVNYKLHFFTRDYLVRYRYNVGLVALPNELLLEIVQHLGRQKDRSRLAQASQRFYPLIMGYIFRYNVRYGGSSLLNYAAKRNLNRMARMILHLGGDVNTQCGLRLGVMNERSTPLATAAFYGHEKMVKMLLESGASHFVDGMRIPLAVAIFKRHENVALILSQEVDSGDVPLGKTRGTVLQIACGAKLVNLVQYYLERGSQSGVRVNVHSLHNRSTALYHVLREDSRKDIFIKRELHEDVYQIVLMLLQHGANPDIRPEIPFSHPVTARAIASRHPDPRVRNLLLKATPVTASQEDPLLIGRPWISFEDEALTFHKLQSEASPSGDSRYAKLWDFLESSNSETLALMDEDGTEYRGTNFEDCTLNSSDIADLVEGGMQGLKKKSEPTEPPPLSSFPQLGIPKASAQHAAKTFWAKIPAQASSGVNSVQKPSISGMGAILQKVKQLERLAETEPFPQLGRPTSTSNDTSKDLWARFQQGKVSQSTSETQRTSPLEEGNGIRRSVNKPSKKKKKKWEPLLITLILEQCLVPIFLHCRARSKVFEALSFCFSAHLPINRGSLNSYAKNQLYSPSPQAQYPHRNLNSKKEDSKYVETLGQISDFLSFSSFHFPPRNNYTCPSSLFGTGLDFVAWLRVYGFAIALSAIPASVLQLEGRNVEKSIALTIGGYMTVL
ncbi:uncharacterized protein BDR25DRAFT_355027 [Lindgomyces ingoldianus]|uniref:Uncharacterized protein n=1 Tax=Lindgomyces ingoldianus TaxID=673940 RepID=A0ACB6QW15_9PLEO|nr:uncharacterized protein BDR25DRAFT_355027 [Lindgomyces ingoldianus]KAF2471121.1 hypothetical protein BDR25DRAFT_355027 [Lindgomyces ingoldianus]